MTQTPSSDNPKRAAAHTSLAPGVGNYSAPVLFFVILALLAYLGQAELGYNHGEFSTAVYEPYADRKSIPSLTGPNPVDAGRDLYNQLCLACHQANGSGNPANGCPPLVQSDWVLEEGPARVIRIILNGAKGPITVSGKEYGSPTGMTPFRDSLTPEQIANIATFVRQAPEWKNNAGAVTPEMVKSALEKTSSRSLQWTAEELLKVSPTEQ